MSDVKEQLNNVAERLSALEQNPSNLTKDSVLADLRKLYDAVVAIDVSQADNEIEQIEPSIAEPTAEKRIEPVVEQKVVQETKDEPVEVAERPVENEVSESVCDKNILAGKLNQAPLEDLRSGIPLNEKFGIIQNLFKGNASDFGDAILKLNNSNSAEEMRHYLDLLKQRLGWDAENESYIAFAGYVERRMMTVTS